MGKFNDHMKAMEAAQKAIDAPPREHAEPVKRYYHPDMSEPIHKNYEDSAPQQQKSPSAGSNNLPADLYGEMDKAYKKNQR